MTNGRARLRPIADRVTNVGAQPDSCESRTLIGDPMQLFPELPQHGTEYENSQRARSHKCQGYEKRKVHMLRGSSIRVNCRSYFSPKIYVVLYHCFYLAETTPNKPGFPHASVRYFLPFKSYSTFHLK